MCAQELRIGKQFPEELDRIIITRLSGRKFSTIKPVVP